MEKLRCAKSQGSDTSHSAISRLRCSRVLAASPVYNISTGRCFLPRAVPTPPEFAAGPPLTRIRPTLKSRMHSLVDVQIFYNLFRTELSRKKCQFLIFLSLLAQESGKLQFEMLPAVLQLAKFRFVNSDHMFWLFSDLSCLDLRRRVSCEGEAGRLCSFGREIPYFIASTRMQSVTPIAKTNCVLWLKPSHPVATKHAPPSRAAVA